MTILATLTVGRGSLIADLAQGGDGMSSAEAQPVTPYALYEATYGGDRAEVARLLDAGLPVDATPGPNYNCPLWVAASQGHDEIVELLLERGADRRCALPGWSPLVIAARSGHLPVVDRLLRAGAGDPETLRSALWGAADLEATDTEGRTALHWASWRRHPAVVRALIDRGASPEREDAFGDRPLLDTADVEAALARMERVGRLVETEARCDVLPLSASGAATPTPGSLTAWGSPVSLPIGSEAWALPPSSSTAIRVRVVATERDTCADSWDNLTLVPIGGVLPEEELWDWMVLFGSNTPLRGPAPETI